MRPASALATDDAAALWLVHLQRALARASHDVRDALNGVSVNLEVIRSRAARPGTSAADVATFADAAGQQLERLTTLIDAVLALGRSEREATDVSRVLRQMVTVCGAASQSSDAAIELRLTGLETVDGMMTKVRGDIVRLALGATLLDAVTGTDRSARASAVVCTIGGNAASVLVTIDAEGRPTRLPESVAPVARAAGVQWTEGPQHLSLAFPRL